MLGLGNDPVEHVGLLRLLYIQREVWLIALVVSRLLRRSVTGHRVPIYLFIASPINIQIRSVHWILKRNGSFDNELIFLSSSHQFSLLKLI